MIPVLSVVVASRDAADSASALAALARSCEGMSAEVIPVASHPGALVPELWAAGLRRATGSVVAFTTSDLLVEPSWARAIVAALAGGSAAGVAGAVQLAPRAPLHVRAAYFARFAAFAPPVRPGPVPHIPADNAGYSRAALERHGAAATDGFWEVEFHARLSDSDGPLVLVEGAAATLRAAPQPLTFIRQRYHHARRFGAYRVRQLGEPRWRVLAAAPVVPFALLARIARRVAGDPAGLRHLVLALPLLVPYVAVWAAGEAVGALALPGARLARPTSIRT